MSLLRRSFRAFPASAVGFSAIIAGLGSYVLLILVAKRVPTVGYADFAAFWSIVVTVGLGVYFPCEQETARDYSGAVNSPRSRLRRVSYGFAGIVTALLIVLLVGLSFFPSFVKFFGSFGLIGALGIAFIGYFVQFPTRGLLSGARRTGLYAATISSEGILRIVLPGVLVLFGANDAASYGVVVGIAALLSVFPAWVSRPQSWLSSPDARLSVFSSRVLRLIIAALAIQLLLNSGILLARVFDTSNTTLAAQILTALSIARIPVFAYQALQVLYMPSVAAAWKSGSVATARRIIGMAALIVGGVGIVSVGAMAILGSWVIGFFFAPRLVLPLAPLVVLTAAVSLFLLAQVLSDATLALGAHTSLLSTWIMGLAAAVLTVIFVADPTYRVILPLGIGSSVVSLVFTITLWHRLRRAH